MKKTIFITAIMLLVASFGFAQKDNENKKMSKEETEVIRVWFLLLKKLWLMKKELRVLRFR